jgi:hypothetical protein
VQGNESPLQPDQSGLGWHHSRADGQKYDVIMSSMTITAERAKVLASASAISARRSG